jgi:hypothetical protein
MRKMVRPVLFPDDLLIDDAEWIDTESEWSEDDGEYESDFICDDSEESDYEPEDWEVQPVILNITVQR